MKQALGRWREPAIGGGPAAMVVLLEYYAPYLDEAERPRLLILMDDPPGGV